MDRKEFFQSAFRMVVGKGLELVEDSTVVKALEKMADDDKQRERPPGAVPEPLFTERCTGCDQCMIACPVNVIMVENLETRLPLIYPNKSPCIHCSGYPCIAACPSGALEKDELPAAIPLGAVAVRNR